MEKYLFFLIGLNVVSFFAGVHRECRRVTWEDIKFLLWETVVITATFALARWVYGTLG